MLRTIRWSIPFVVLLMAADAGAQYGGYGWNGWGSAGGNMTRGLGNLYAGRGALNESNAVAGAINTNTAMRWNNALAQASRASASRYAAEKRHEFQKSLRDRAAIEDRIRNHPEPRDITDGDTLNLLLSELLSPENAARSLAEIKTPLRSDSIRDIPFEYASEDLTLCLNQMALDDQWPLALRVEAFKPERDALHKVVGAAMKADEDGSLDPTMIAAVQTAIDNLRAKFEREIKPTSPDYYPARDRIKAMAGITKMLYSPKMEQVLAELEEYQGTTLGDLLGFMQSFNLRFAPANSFRQRQIYQKLYPMFAELTYGSSTSRAAGAVEKAAGDAVGDLQSAATDLFKDR